MNSKVVLPLSLSLILLTGCSTQKLEQEFEQEFITACTNKGTQEWLCQCMYGKLKKEESIADDIALWGVQGVPDKDINKAALACLPGKKANL